MNSKKSFILSLMVNYGIVFFITLSHDILFKKKVV